MSLFNQISSWLAAALPPSIMPKAKGKALTLDGYRKGSVAQTAPINKTDRQSISRDRVAQARAAATTGKALRELLRGSPDMSNANSALLRTGIPDRFSLVAKDMDGRINPEATALAHQLLNRICYLGNADGSFNSQPSLQSLSEMFAVELQVEGAMCLEVALDKARVPALFRVVPVSTLVFKEDDIGFTLVQRIAGVDTDLDSPTIIYVALDQHAVDLYPSSPLEPGIQAVLADVDFTDDMRKVLKRAVLPRFVATIDSERVKKFTPPEILADPEKFQEYKLALIADCESVINGLEPEEALVSYDMIDYKFVDGGKDPSAIIERIQGVLNSKLASGTRTLPVVLGHGGTSNASSAEAMLYMKQANMLRVKLNELYSKALTLAVRLLGMDVIVQFTYDSVDLRPDSELESFKAMKQSRILELLSLGLITDEAASIALTGDLPPAGAPKLAGTMFKYGAAQSANPNSNTAVEQTVKSDAPNGAKSQNTKK